MMTASTPAEVATLWNCSVDHVLDLIRSKRLVGFSLSKPGSKRPRWRVSADAIAAYEAQNQAQVALKPTRRKRKRDEAVIQFYR